MDDPGSTRDEPFERPPAGHADLCAAGVIEILDPARTLEPAAMQWLREMSCRAMEELGVGARGEVRVRVVRDDEMAKAHLRYKKVEGTTDVLTFDLSPPGGALDADILVCVDEARRQAEARGHTPERELLLYIVHGVLHCMGYDDATPEEAAAMHAREDEVLTAIGVGATYAIADRTGGDASAAGASEGGPWA